MDNQLNHCKKECPLLGAALIRLTKCKYAIVSLSDYDWISEMNWQAAEKPNGYYAVNYKYVMHRYIMGLEKGNKMQVDHINRNGLDNRRCNLRIVTPAQNRMNRSSGGYSPYKGVRWDSDKQRWVAYIGNDKFGYFDDEDDAALAYNKIAKERYGEFAFLNKIQESG